VTVLPVPRMTTPSPEPRAAGSLTPGGGLGGATPAPNVPAVPAVPPPDPSTPALIPTPPALARLGYRAVSLRSVTAEEVATDEGEVAEFRRDGLQGIANMELVGVNRPGGDYIASVYVLRFPDGPSASRELAYSNKANRANGYRDVPVPESAAPPG